MKVHGTKIKVGMSSSSRSESVVLSKSRLPPKNASTVPDTPCGTSTIFDLCKTSNDKCFHKKRKMRRKEVGGERGRDSSKDTGEASGDVDTIASTEKTTKESTPSWKKSSASSSSAPSAAMGPQVEIVNGKIVLRESSLTVPVHGPATHEDFEEVEEGIHPTAKYSSFTQHVHSSPWGIEETKQFYDALRQCGTDFTLMQAFFPHRTRKHLKLKFVREEKEHPALIKATLNAQLPLDLAPFEVHLGSIMDKSNASPSSKRQKTESPPCDDSCEGADEGSSSVRPDDGNGSPVTSPTSQQEVSHPSITPSLVDV